MINSVSNNKSIFFLGFSLVSVALLISAFPNRSEAAVSETLVELDNQYRYKGFDFQINEKLGRARLVVALRDLQASTEESGDTSKAFLVSGLRYDQNRQEIVFEREGTYAVCATVTEKRFLFARYLKIKKTENCEITANERTESWDNGFESGTRTVTDLVFSAH